MLKFLSALFSPAEAPSDHLIQDAPATEIVAPGVPPFPFADSLQVINHLPVPDWDALIRWLDDIADPVVKPQIWAECELAWLLHLRQALGEHYTLCREGETLILSALKGNVLKAAFDFIARTRQRIVRLLDGIALIPEYGYDIVIIFDSEDDYYDYISRYYADEGEYAYSSGVYLGEGCGHFATISYDLKQMEPVIAHEMTHSFLSHLPLPLWLNEGITVNTEHRICPPGQPLFTPKQMYEKHVKFWTTEHIQQFWSGESFHRTDDGGMLSYDLAKIFISNFSTNWDQFKAFVLAANADDAGKSAAAQYLGVSLGASVTTLFDKAPDAAWQPDPTTWHQSV